jgi:hypothetical protein
MLCVLHTWCDGSGCHVVSVSTNHPCAFELLLCNWIVLNAIQHCAFCAFYAMLPLLQQPEGCFSSGMYVVRRHACLTTPSTAPLTPAHDTEDLT